MYKHGFIVRLRTEAGLAIPPHPATRSGGDSRLFVEFSILPSSHCRLFTLLDRVLD
jgi:hypothetical protein